MPRVARSVRAVTAWLLRSRWPLGLLLAALLLTGSLLFAADEQLVLGRPWARLRSRPSETSRAVAIVYGNDVLAVLERKDGWLKVSTAGKAVGWLSAADAADAGAPSAATPRPVAATGSVSPSPVPAAAAPSPGGRRPTAATLPPLPPVGGAPTSADTLRRMGYGEAARRKLTDLLLRERDTPTAYSATREMLMYHPVGDLPPLQGGRIPPDARASALQLRTSVLLQEAQTLVGEGKPWDGIFLYQALVQGEPDNGRAYLDLLDLLTGVMMQSVNSRNMENLGLAVSIYRSTYPDLPLPPAIQARVGGKK